MFALQANEALVESISRQLTLQIIPQVMAGLQLAVNSHATPQQLLGLQLAYNGHTTQQQLLASSLLFVAALRKKQTQLRQVTGCIHGVTSL